MKSILFHTVVFLAVVSLLGWLVIAFINDRTAIEREWQRKQAEAHGIRS